MSDIVLATANARYSHSALGLRCLRAGLGDLRDRCRILEFVLEDWTESMAEAILALEPEIVGLGVHIWNTDAMGALCRMLKALRPDLRLVLGGPELVDPQDLPAWTAEADYIVSGEGEQAFAGLCRALLEGRRPEERLLRGRIRDLAEQPLPQGEYTDEDIAQRTLYVESSRGCPYGCEFCLSSLDRKVRRFPMERVLSSLDELWSRGARRFKFVDRSLHLTGAQALLDFFLGRADDPELFVHFELVPEACDGALLEALAAFPAGSLHLEVGVQSFDAAVCARIGRRSDPDQVEAALRRLKQQTQALLHADLVLGLPGEDLASIRDGFDRLHAIGPDEIQVGILKRLRGAPIARHTEAFAMVYRPQAPYDVLQTSTLGFAQLQELKRFARHHERLVNSGNFASCMERIMAGPSAFEAFAAFSRWIFGRTGRSVGLSISRAASFIFDYLVDELHLADGEAAGMLVDDFAVAGRRKGLPDAIRRKAPAGYRKA